MASKAYDRNGVRYADRSREQWRIKTARPDRPFRAVDGEGGNVAEEGTLFGARHQYLSLRAGPDLLETGHPLQWKDCLSFLSDLDPSYLYVSYFFDYDVTMIIRTLPEERARRLLYPALREFHDSPFALPVRVGDFEIDYLPHKEFRVRRLGYSKWVIVSDTGQFFQGAFLTTLRKWEIGTPEELAMIEKGKKDRAGFTQQTDEIRAYNALECVLLEDLMTQFRAVCRETGYEPRKYQGPGHLASAMLERHGVPRRDAIPILQNPEFKERAQAAYYGGRFETTAAGPVAGTVHQYDINGAYVGLLRSLPCLTHGTWRQVHDRPDGGIWFGEVHFDHVPPGFLCHLPMRDKNGNISYPKTGNGTYWGVELEAAEKAGTSLDFHTGWSYHSNCACRWFDFVDGYYADRLRLGKTAKGYVLKLAGNSIYGKLAQSIGYAPWANPVWAGLITAGCRAQLIDAYRGHEKDILMLATDGLFSLKPLDVKISRDLGDWEHTTHDTFFIVQPGIYFTGDEPKSRGVERGKITTMRPEFEEQWAKFVASHGVDHTVSIPVTNFITAKQAIQRGKWKLAGTWSEELREISFDWSIKRKRGLSRMIGGTMRTYPHNGQPDLMSVPYSRIIGGGLRHPDTEILDPALAEAERISQQPDWAEPLFDR